VALVIFGILFALFHFATPGSHPGFLPTCSLRIIGWGSTNLYAQSLVLVLFHLSWNFFQGPILVPGKRTYLPSMLVAEPKAIFFITGGISGSRVDPQYDRVGHRPLRTDLRVREEIFQGSEP